LVDTGSEINLISEPAVQRLGLEMRTLERPTRINLALDNNAPKPLVLNHFTTAMLTDPASPLQFLDVHLKISRIVGDYNMILGTPFLSRFHLSVSISSQSIMCNESTRSIFDYWCKNHDEPLRDTQCKNPKETTPPEGLEGRLLKDFEDLFPADIPAVSMDNDTVGQDIDATFPNKMQDAASKV
jgi:hypothetical protein